MKLRDLIMANNADKYSEEKIHARIKKHLPLEIMNRFPQGLQLQLPENRLFLQSAGSRQVHVELFDVDTNGTIIAQKSDLNAATPDCLYSHCRISMGTIEFVYQSNTESQLYEWQKTGYKAHDYSSIEETLNNLNVAMVGEFGQLLKTNLYRGPGLPGSSEFMQKIHKAAIQDPMPGLEDFLFCLRNLLANLNESKPRAKLLHKIMRSIEHLQFELKRYISRYARWQSSFVKSFQERLHAYTHGGLGVRMNFPGARKKLEDYKARVAISQERLKAYHYAYYIVDKRLEMLGKDVKAMMKLNRPHLVWLFEQARANDACGMGNLPNDMIRLIIRQAEAQEKARVL